MTTEERPEAESPTQAELMSDPRAQLEKALIADYLRTRGYELEKLHELPEELAKQLMTEASTYASGKLTEIEARSHFIHEIHGVSPPL